MKKNLLLLLGSIIGLMALAADNRDVFSYQLQPAEAQEIRIDGIIDENEWFQFEPLSRFINKWP